MVKNMGIPAGRKVKPTGTPKEKPTKKEIKKEGKPLVRVELMDNIIILRRPDCVK